jgi:hypothetical protein
MAPTMKATSANKTTFFLPRLSARIPETGETRSAKRAVDEVMSDLSSVVSGRPRALPIETRVADITPVSSMLHQLTKTHSPSLPQKVESYIQIKAQ